MRFRPRLWTSVAVLPVLALLIGLGIWQLQRQEWKEGLIALRAERVYSPALDLVPRTRVDRITERGSFHGQLPPQSGLATIAGDAEAFEYRPIRLAGRWQHDHSIHLLNRTLDGRVGEHLVTPLALTQGGVVLVDRGWVPPRGAADSGDYAGPDGRVIVEGYIRRFSAPGSFTPDNEPGRDNWFWLDPAAIGTSIGETVEAGFYVVAAPGETAGPPVGSVPEIALRNPHLHYALTWFGVAAALVGVYIAFHIKRRD
jgi:surfeit locus 1 family protein